jgi:predicted ABC-type transport system involved in lysophospholipase L1 biosynthesis ATPase subunit
VLVTHDPTVAAAADRIVELRDGRIVADAAAQ